MGGETEQNVSGWTVDTLKAFVLTILDDRLAFSSDAMNARLDGIVNVGAAHDQRYQERFDAQEQAVKLALAGYEREFHEHIQQVVRETAAALAASEKAIEKAEVATEKRFDSVNAFRQQLAEQAATFLPRNEYDRAHIDLSHRLDDSVKALRETFEQAVKTLESKIDGLQRQLGTVEALVK